MAGGAGHHPLTDITQHGFQVLGGGLDEEVRALLKSCPEAEAAVAEWLESKATAKALARITKARAPLRDAFYTIKNSFSG